MTDTNHDSPSTPEVPAAKPTAFRMVGDMAPLFAALSVAQGAFGPVKRTRDNPFFKSKYADLSDVIDATRAALAANGLCAFQPPAKDAGGRWTVTTILAHQSGAYVVAEASMPSVEDWQKLGSAITYCRRYQLSGLLGVASEEDDDGNAISGKEQPASRPPAAPPSRPAKPPEAAKPAPKEEPKPAPREEPKAAPKEEPKAAPPAPAEPAPPAEAPPVVHDADGAVLEEVTNPYPSYVEPENKMMATSSTKKNLGDLARAKRLDRASLNELSMKTLGIKAEQLVYEADFQRLLRRIDTGAAQ